MFFQKITISRPGGGSCTIKTASFQPDSADGGTDHQQLVVRQQHKRAAAAAAPWAAFDRLTPQLTPERLRFLEALLEEEEVVEGAQQEVVSVADSEEELSMLEALLTEEEEEDEEEDDVEVEARQEPPSSDMEEVSVEHLRSSAKRDRATARLGEDQEPRRRRARFEPPTLYTEAAEVEEVDDDDDDVLELGVDSECQAVIDRVCDEPPHEVDMNRPSMEVDRQDLGDGVTRLSSESETDDDDGGDDDDDDDDADADDDDEVCVDEKAREPPVETTLNELEDGEYYTDDEDEEDDNIVVTISNKCNEDRAGELAAIDSMMHASGNLYKSAYSIALACKEKNKSVALVDFDRLQAQITSTFGRLTQNNRCRMPSVALPVYVNGISFSALRWLHLPNRLYDSELALRTQQMACSWIYNDEDETAASAKRTWIEDFNRAYADTSIVESNWDYFVCLEISYLKAKVVGGGEQKGVVGMAAAYVRNTGGKITLLDFANVKLSCNTRNVAYGRVDTILRQKNCRAVLVYCKNAGDIEDFYTSNMYPWSALLASVSHKTFNLVERFRFNVITDKKDICIDARRHAPCCSLCNLNVFLLNLGCMDHHASGRPGRHRGNIRPWPRYTVERTGQAAPDVKLCVCNGITYIDYNGLVKMTRVSQRNRRRRRGAGERDVQCVLVACECTASR